MIDDETPDEPMEPGAPDEPMPEPDVPDPDESGAPTPADQLSAGASRLRGRVSERLRTEGARFDSERAGDFAGSLRAVGQAPFVVAGAVGALAATVAGLTLSLIMWVVLSDSLVTGFGLERDGHRFHSLWGAVCTFWLVLSQVPFHVFTVTGSGSALLGLVLVLAVLVGAARLLVLRRVPGAPLGTQRLALAVFALISGVLGLVVSLFPYHLELPDPGGFGSVPEPPFHAVHGWAFVLPAVWALVAGVIVLGRSTLAVVPRSGARWWTDYVVAPLRVLGGTLVLTTVFGFVSALISALGGQAKRQAVQFAIVQVLDEGVAFFRNGALVELHAIHRAFNGAHYAYDLIVSVVVVWLGALYAGFVSARATRASTPGQGMLCGALVGPVWAVAIAIVSELAKGIDTSGDFSGWKLFFSVLIGGAVLGAAGGLLALRSVDAVRGEPANELSVIDPDPPQV